MNCDLESSFLLVYFSGPLIITHGPHGAAPTDPTLSGPIFRGNQKSLIEEEQTIYNG
jgi:hypothetical protein